MAEDRWEFELEDLDSDEPDRLEPGTPNPEHVLFLVLGVVAALMALAQMFALL